MSEAELEESLRRDRLKRKRFVAVLITSLCALGAGLYYAVFADFSAPIHLVGGKVLRRRGAPP